MHVFLEVRIGNLMENFIMLRQAKLDYMKMRFIIVSKINVRMWMLHPHFKMKKSAHAAIEGFTWTTLGGIIRT